MKIGLVQIAVEAGRPDKNLFKILEKIEEAKKQGVKIIIFSEMVVPGYLLGDEWENKSFTSELMEANKTILDASEGIVVVWGNIFVDPLKKGEDGRERKYNAVFIAQNKKWIGNGVFEGRTYKALMPKYREFDDERHFYSLVKEADEKGITIDEALQPFEVEVDGNKIKLGLMLCEDMWSDDYNINPGKILVQNGAEILINLSCSPWTYRKNAKRHRIVKSLIIETKTPFLYCNNTGIQNNGKNIFLFDGNSTAYNRDGDVVAQTQDYTEGMMVLEMDDIKDMRIIEEINDKKRDVELLYKGLIYGIKIFFDSLANKRVVIGLSGGIDSAVVATILVEALGNQNVLAINMPSKYNSDLTKNAAKKLAETLGIKYSVVPISESIDMSLRQMKDIGLTPSDFVIENMQARDRGSRLLAMIAASTEGVFVNNGNKTEIALGYCTLYGDVSGAIAPIGDIYKGQVYELARYINLIKGKQVIPEEVLKVVPSAELNNEQNVTKGLGDPMDYPYHDRLIKAFVEWRMDPTELLEKYDNGTITEDLDLLEDIGTYFVNREKFIEDLEHKWRLF